MEEEEEEEEEIVLGPPLSKSATLVLIIEARQRYDGTPQNLLTREHFAEMIRFEEWLYNLTIPSPSGNSTSPDQVTTFYQMCIKSRITSQEDEEEWAELCKTDESYCVVPAPEKCKTSQKPLDFIYDRKTDSYALEKYRNDYELLSKVRTGKGD